ncbi:DUF305 domain-containing protein [Ornithinimicrobium cerasi]|uniref:DUF305 domain-containing protein n=1 Tax=Ornithinimicrobium cerasi TaxID=2248773 RepID=UPI0013796A47|nr:DUF305 domain-containing protein [Ornithinimicrobium cerasi]
MPDVVTGADLAFVRGMLLHHAQALEMTELVPDRATREDITLFAERIELSQAEEIGVMQDWLRGRGEPVFELGGIQAHEHPEQMSGMLTGEQMAELAGTSGADFDLLFLQSMYRHHEGAIAMVDELSDAGGAQDPFIFELAKEIDNDQRIEMDRMVGMLADLGATPPATDG